jgi:hypothetical protein
MPSYTNRRAKREAARARRPTCGVTGTRLFVLCVPDSIRAAFFVRGVCRRMRADGAPHLGPFHGARDGLAGHRIGRRAQRPRLRTQATQFDSVLRCARPRNYPGIGRSLGFISQSRRRVEVRESKSVRDGRRRDNDRAKGAGRGRLGAVSDHRPCDRVSPDEWSKDQWSSGADARSAT